MNRTLELLYYINYFNGQGVINSLFNTASQDKSIQTIDDLCNFFEGEMECWESEMECWMSEG